LETWNVFNRVQILACAFLALAWLGGRWGYSYGRNLILGSDATARSYPSWWIAIGLFWLFAFIVVATFILYFLGQSRKPVHPAWKTVCVGNAFGSCLLFALAMITSDTSVVVAVSPLGLAGLRFWLLNCGFVSCLFDLFCIFKAMDAAAAGTSAVSSLQS
jgi:hypothetical protein